MFFYLRAYIERHTGFEGIINDVRDEVSRLIQRIDETTDKDISLIEDKEKNLKALLEETDRRMAALNREFARRENAEDTYRRLGRFPIIEQAPPPESPPQEESPAEELPSQEEQLRELVRSGFSPQVIASRLGISIAEAELAVAIQERRNS